MKTLTLNIENVEDIEYLESIIIIVCSIHLIYTGIAYNHNICEFNICDPRKCRMHKKIHITSMHCLAAQLQFYPTA